MTIRSQRDFLGDLFLIAVGGGFAIGATQYSFGVASRPGPGYFPLGLGIILTILGLIVPVTSFVRKVEGGDPVGAIPWRPLICVVGALVFFGFALPRIGFVISFPLMIIFMAIMAFCAIGCYTLGNNNFEVYCAVLFAVVGFTRLKLGFEPAPLILGFVLGPLMEENLRRALLLSNGNWSVFVTQPISASMLAISVVMIVAIALPAIKAKRKEAFKDGE